MTDFTDTLQLKSFKYPTISEKEVLDALNEAAHAIEGIYEGVEQTPNMLAEQMFTTTLYTVELVLQKYQNKLSDSLTDLVLPY